MNQLNNRLITQATNNHSINSEVKFGNNFKIAHHLIKGDFYYNNVDYLFTFKYKNTQSLNLEYKACQIKGDITNIFNGRAYVFVKNVDYNSCHNINNTTFINRHLNFIYNKLYKSTLREPEKIIALIFGDTSAINSNYIEEVKDVGIYHLLAVSGSHIATISFIVYQSLVRFNLPKFIINTIIILLLILFAFYTDFAPSALRAIIGTIIFIVLPRKYKITSIDILGLVFILLTMCYPNIIYDVGFQFSFLISLFILLSLPLCSSLPFKNFLLLSLIAQLSSFIISIYHFNQLQWLGLFSNIIFVPLYSFVIFPLAICNFIVYHFVNNITLLNIITNKVFKFHDLLLDLFLPFQKLRLFITFHSMLELFIYFILIFFIILFVCHKRLIYSLLVILLFIICICIFTKPSSSTITFLNVGQGDSLIFQTKNQETVMVDTGGTENSTEENYQISKHHIMSTLKSKGVNTIDYLIITHPHADHMAELPYLAKHLKIKKLMIYLASYPPNKLFRIEQICHSNHIQLIDASRINTINLNSSTIHFFHTYIPTSNDKNEQSVILLIDYLKYKILLMGDATKNNENILIQKYNLPKIDILKVGHHGSKTSSSEQFLNIIRPSISIISSGKHNKYPLPNEETIEKLKSFNSKIYNTQNDGEITIDLDRDLKISFK
ncbi:DNA internalization-related competence protein ComEC/Rec2 [Staphylococcus devriesei]|uniref:DNA internalization-related competence protein ComEC/Rec2 n=3 Tax=Staphylococcus devriesei TaxID=586733 RepID=UPI000E02A21A|nr:DNA internalization-related competence protein ComEC/Rec2 [Staphylococcus devriesei]SUM03444.1 competence protein ComEC [Staphylococcus devriesei]